MPKAPCSEKFLSSITGKISYQYHVEPGSVKYLGKSWFKRCCKKRLLVFEVDKTKICGCGCRKYHYYNICFRVYVCPCEFCCKISE